MSQRTRRPWLAGLAGLALSMLVGACGSSASTGSGSEPKVTLKFSCPCTTDQPQTKAMQRFADDVKKQTNGAVTIELFPNGSLLSQNVEFQGLQKDSVDMAYAAPDTFAPQVAEMEVLLTPYLYTKWSQVEDTFRSADGQKLVPLSIQRLGVRPLDIQNLGARELNLAVTKHINTPGDMRGIKLRMPPGPYWAKLGAAMGAQVTPVAFNEIYLALQTGTVQGQDNPVATDVANKFYEVTKQLILTNHVFSAVLPSINDKAWQRLSASEQKAVVQAIKDADQWADTQVQDTQDQGIALMKQHGVQVYSPDVKAFQVAVLKAYLCDSTWTGQFLPGMLKSVEKSTAAAIPSC
jgi:tripartite ATP-independent transporter DctP family solute receptor